MVQSLVYLMHNGRRTLGAFMKYFSLLMISGLSLSAHANIQRPHTVKDVELKPLYLMHTRHGIAKLSKSEMLFKENLPMQLALPLQKISNLPYVR